MRAASRADGSGSYDGTLVQVDGRWLIAAVVPAEVWTGGAELSRVDRLN